MQTADFISEYLRLFPSNKQKFDAGAFFSNFDFGINFSKKSCFHHDFVKRLEPFLLHAINTTSV